MAVVIDNRNGKSTAVSKFHPAPPEDRRRDVGHGLPPGAPTEVRDKSRALRSHRFRRQGRYFTGTTFPQRLSQDYSADEDKVSEAIRRAGAGGIATSRSRCACLPCANRPWPFNSSSSLTREHEINTLVGRTKLLTSMTAPFLRALLRHFWSNSGLS